MVNQNPEQKARDLIDKKLVEAGWAVQSKDSIDLNAARGVAIREYSSDTGPMDYMLMVDGKPCGVIEAKKAEEAHKLSTVEEQSDEYSTSKLKFFGKQDLRFIYESTGEITRIRDTHDPKTRAREVFSFMKPDTIADELAKKDTLRERLRHFPALDPTGLRDCQVRAITNLEESFGKVRPRALVQMATGSGKTFTAITAVYRLLKYAGAKRILMLVDTKNLGEQAEQEFVNYLPRGEQHKFPDLYPVQRLKSRTVNEASRVCISTIQRMYSILRGEDLDEKLEESPADWKSKDPVEVVYNAKLPPEYFDFVVIDECHRSIYNLWKQVLDYFDAFMIGLTATPDARTYGFFNKNVVSEYTHEQAVVDGVNVPSEVYVIETEITKNGGKIAPQQYIERREKLTRKKRWSQLDEELKYEGKDLDRNVVSPSQIRTVIQAFKDALPTIFPGRAEVPKTLIFAKDDSHAEDIIKVVREVFDEEDKFCKKITYQTDEDPKSLLSQFRNEYNPRIAVTVDMIATGTDIRPLECLLFMRDVRSKNYFEQMKGRGTRTFSEDDLRKVTPSAKGKKTHFVIVDAVGVCKSVKTSIRPFESKPSVPLKDLMTGASLRALDEDSTASLAGRLLRLDGQLTDEEKRSVSELTGGVPLNKVAGGLLESIDPDVIEQRAEAIRLKKPSLTPEAAEVEARKELKAEACRFFTGLFTDGVLKLKKAHDQIIDNDNLDQVLVSGWDNDETARANEIIERFTSYLVAHRAEIEALDILYGIPYRRRELTLKMVKELAEKLKAHDETLTPDNVWRAYHRLGVAKMPTAGRAEPALVALVRYVAKIDKVLTPFASTVDANFQAWTFKYNAVHPGARLTEEQMSFLRMIRDHVSSSFHISFEDMEYAPFDSIGGPFRFRKLFGDRANAILDDLNAALAA